MVLQLTAKHTKCAQNARKRHFSACLVAFLMCALCAIWHFSACFAAIATCSMSAHTCTHACNLSASRLLAACGAKVRYENHSDKLLCENFTMKRIFRPKASFLPHRFMPNAAPYVSEAAWFQHGIGPKATLFVTFLQPYRAAMRHADD